MINYCCKPIVRYFTFDLFYARQLDIATALENTCPRVYKKVTKYASLGQEFFTDNTSSLLLICRHRS